MRLTAQDRQPTHGLLLALRTIQPRRSRRLGARRSG